MAKFWQKHHFYVAFSAAFCLQCAAISAPNTRPIPVPRPEIAQSEGAAPVITTPAATAIKTVSALPKPRPDYTAPAIDVSAKSSSSNIKPGKTTVSDNDAELLRSISQAYSATKSMKAKFVQLSGNSRTTGTLTLLKPGKFHFAYAPPSSIDVLCDGKTVLVRDKKLNTNDTYLLDQTPLRVLLLQKLDLTQDVKVVHIKRGQDMITVKIDESSSALQGTITLYFARDTFALQQWTIIDGQGIETDVALSDVQTNVAIDGKQFNIDLETLRQNQNSNN